MNDDMDLTSRTLGRAMKMMDDAMAKPKPDRPLTPHEPAIRRLLAEHRLLRMALAHLVTPTFVGRQTAEQYARKCLAVVGHKPLVAADVLGQREVYDLWRDEAQVEQEVTDES